MIRYLILVLLFVGIVLCKEKEKEKEKEFALTEELTQLLDAYDNLVTSYDDLLTILSDDKYTDLITELLGNVIDELSYDFIFDINHYDTYRVEYKNKVNVICSYKDKPYDYGQCVRDNKMWQVCCMDGWRTCDVCSEITCCN